MKKTIYLILLVIGLGFFNRCTKETPEPENPFSKIDHPSSPTNPDTVGPATIVGLHRNIFLTKCAVPGCHDGNFEPDFRTVESSYQTLVYAPIIKNNLANSFEFRVIPFEKEQSVLYERVTNCCFVNENDRMPQDNIGTALPQNDINNIGAWIANGARNSKGEVSPKPDKEPLLQLFFAISTNFQINYSDVSFRPDNQPYNPFVLPSGVNNFFIFVPVSDDNTAINQLQNSKLLFSTMMDDFSNAITLNGSYLQIPDDPNVKGFIFTIDTSVFPAGVQHFMRFRINDPALPGVTTEFPKNSTTIYYKGFWSMIKS